MKHSPSLAFAAALAVVVLFTFKPQVYSTTVTWDGTTSGDATWTNPDSNSWTGATYNDGDIAQFLGAGAGTVTIDSGGVSPGSVIVNGSAAYTFTGGAISGTGTTLTKSGSGVLNLSNANTYTGLTIVNGGGILDVGLISSNAISNSSGLLLGTSGSSGVLQGNGLFTRSLSGTATPGAGQVASQEGGFAARGGDLTINFGGAGSEFALNTSGYVFGNNFIFGSATADSKVIVLNKLNINSTGGRTITVYAGIGGDAATSAEFSGIIRNASSSAVQIRKNGDGMLILSNVANTFNGQVLINQGSLSITKIKDVGGGSSSLGAPTTVASGTIKIGSGGSTGRLLYVGTGDSTDRVIDLSGSTGGAILDQSGTGLLRFTTDLSVSGSGSKTLTLQGSTAGTGEYAGIIGNPVSGSLSLAKNGSGTWTLSGANTYSGDTKINGGTLALSNDLALQNSAFDTSGAGIMTLSVTTPTFGGLKGSTDLASVITTGYSGVTELTLNVGSAASHSYSGVIANGAANMALTKTGAGSQTLSGASGYSGVTSIKNGRLVLDAGDNRLVSTGAVILGDTGTAGTLVLGGASASNQTLASLTTTGLGGSVVGGNTTNSTLTLNIASGSSTFAGTLGGAGTNENKLAVTLSGPGVLNLTGTNNTYSGLTNVTDSGVLDVGTINGGALSSSSGLLLGSSVTGSGIYGILQGNGTFTRSLGSGATPSSSQVASAAGGFAARGGQLTLNFGGAGAVFGLNQGGFKFGNNFIFGSSTADSKVVLINPININSGGVNGTRKFTVVAGIGGADATSADLQGVISDSNATTPNGIRKEGDGTLILSANNTYTGPTQVIAGTVQIGNGSTTGSLTSSTANGADGSVSISSGAILSFNRSDSLLFENLVKGAGEVRQIGSGTTTLTAANTYTGTTTISAGALQLGDGGTGGSLSTSSAISVDSGATFAVKQSDTVTQGTDFSGAAITGAGGFTQAGGGTTIFTAANTYTGATTISAGTLQLGAGGTSGSLSTSSAISVGSGATFVVNQSDTVTQGTDFSGTAITGAGSFTQAGSGTTIFTAANAYSGTTTVSAGNLQVGSNSVGQTGTGDVTVQSGGMLLGTGIIRGSNFTAESGSTLHAGDSMADSSFGTLNFTPATGSGTQSLQGGIILGIGTANNDGGIDSTFGGNEVGSAGYLAYVNDISRSQGLGTGSHDLLSFNTAGDASGYNMNFLTTTGTLQVLGSGFTAEIGQVFNLLDWSNLVTTNFTGFDLGTNYRDGTGDDASQFDLPTLSAGLFWDVSQFTTSGIIVVVPEPSRVFLLLLGLAGLITRRRRDRLYK